MLLKVRLAPLMAVISILSAMPMCTFPQAADQQTHQAGWLYAQGNINLIDAAVRKGVKKFILLTSIGTGDSKDAPPKQVYDVLKPVLLEKEKAEDHLKVGSANNLLETPRHG